MKTSFRHLLVVLAVSTGCLGATCNKTQVVKTVLDVAEMSCLFFHDDIEDDKTLAKICNIAEELLPEVRKVVFARKDALAKKAAAKPVPSASVSGK